MSRTLTPALLAAALTLGAVAAEAQEAFTTRIEPRPYYGATVTIEHGVRVTRPLPPERQVIINPNNTPLALGFNDTRVVETSTSNNFFAPVPDLPVRAGTSAWFPTRFGHGHHNWRR